jgi:hypothetical protein
MKGLMIVAGLLVLALLLVACAGSGSDPSKTVEQYLQAKVAGDADTMRRLLCSEMEADLDREMASFASVDAKIEDMTCQQDGSVVRCSGRIVAVYGTENTEFPLSSYRVLQEDGEWKWCGEAR